MGRGILARLHIGGPSTAGTAERPAPPPDPHVLELRIHGVNNTPPYGMLEVLPADAEKARGDSLGSFWVPTAAALAHARQVPDTHQDHIPADVHREAYSWGQMTRTSPSLPGNVGKGAVSAASRAGWMLLLPLGLVNVAYWSRELDETAKYARGARWIRIFGFGLSLLLVAAVADVSLDLVGTQCIIDNPNSAATACAALPGWLTWLGSYPWPQRLALLSLVPVGALLLLYWLASGSRTKYEVPTSSPVKESGAKPPATSAGAGARTRILAMPGLWGRWGLTQSMALVHFAGGLALVVLTLSWSQVYAGYPSCVSPASFFDSPACGLGGDAIGGSPLFAAFVAVAMLVLAGSTWLIAVAQADAINPASTRKGRTAVGLFLVAVVLFGANVVALCLHDERNLDAAQLLGLRVVPALLVTALFLIALVGLTWRGAVGLTVVASVLAIGALAALAWVTVTRDPVTGLPANGPLALACTVFVLLFAVVGLWPRAAGAASAGTRAGTTPPLRQQAWSGRGPGVFLLLSLGSMMMLTGLLVVAVGDWLNGGAKPQCLNPDYARLHPDGCGAPLAQIQIPQTYAEFAVATAMGLVLVALLVVGFGVLVPAFRAWRHRPALIPEPRFGRSEDQAEVARDAEVPRPAGTLATLQHRADLRAAVGRAKGIAALSHRVELFLALIAVGLAAAVALALLITVRWQPPSALVSLGLWATALLWAGVLARVVTTDGSAPNRPLAIVWDIVCFLPRSAHPLGPPCYAERAVPEIAARMDAWLREPAAASATVQTAPTAPTAPEGRQVVLSAHSMGVVLAVAALFTGEKDNPGRSGRVALVSYGSQIRPYFGRILPELFGPHIIGTIGCGPTDLNWDPWQAQEIADTSADPTEASPPSDTLVHRLGARDGHDPAWVNLWRRTDPIGFPVGGYSPNLIDRGAEAIDATAFVATVAGHSGYPRTSAYRRAMTEVRSRLRP
ncbi:hypothetical protein [Pengzhenrongella phosphoraccumulans]|uniref:hypothetical protein n=1 Tax=Pengzhenrongella phosphoraccumulans TaxID=3114394 RepID=UPI003890DC47